MLEGCISLLKRSERLTKLLFRSEIHPSSTSNIRGSLTSPTEKTFKEYRFCAIEHPSIKPSRAMKEVAFFDPSKAEADKTCKDYVKDAEELYHKLQKKLQGKPYNQADIHNGNLLLTSMKSEVILRSIISDLLDHHKQSSKKRRVLKLELQETERRASGYHSTFEKLLADADKKEKLYKARTYVSYGSLLKIILILQLNLLDKVPYPTERYHNFGLVQMGLYALLLLFVALPVQMASRTISQYSKALVINSWNFCPFFKGIGWISLIVGGYYMLASVSTVSIALYMFIDVLRGRVGWTSCLGGENEFCSSAASEYTKRVPCDVATGGHDSMVMHSGIVYYQTVLKEAFDLSNKSMKFTGLICIFSIWALVCTFMLIGFERFIKVVEILFAPILISASLILIALINGNEASAIGIHHLIHMDLQDISILQRNLLLFDVLLNAQVVNGVIIYLSAHAPRNENPIVDTYIFGITELFIHYTTTIFVFAAAGFLQGYYKAVHPTCFLIYRDITLLAVIPEYLSRIYLGQTLVVLYLAFLILTQIVYIVIVGFTIVKSATDMLEEGAAHMYAVFVLVATGVAMNFFLHLSSSPDSRINQKIISCIELAALIAVAVFISSIIFIYSTAKLTSNITVMVGARPEPLYNRLIKLSFLLIVFIGYSNIYHIMENPAIEDWGLIFQFIFIVFLPTIFSALFKISESLRTAKFTLFLPDPSWDFKCISKMKDVDSPQYKQGLFCTHKCLRDQVYIKIKENRSESIRKCFETLSKD